MPIATGFPGDRTLYAWAEGPKELKVIGCRQRVEGRAEGFFSGAVQINNTCCEVPLIRDKV